MKKDAMPFIVPAATRLKAGRERLGISQADAARACGMSRASWNDLETGRRIPTLDRLWDVAFLLRLDPHELDPRFISCAIANPSPRNRRKPTG